MTRSPNAVWPFFVYHSPTQIFLIKNIFAPNPTPSPNIGILQNEVWLGKQNKQTAEYHHNDFAFLVFHLIVF